MTLDNKLRASNRAVFAIHEDEQGAKTQAFNWLFEANEPRTLAFVFVTEDGKFGSFVAFDAKAAQRLIEGTQWRFVSFARCTYVQAHKVFNGWEKF